MGVVNPVVYPVTYVCLISGEFNTVNSLLIEVNAKIHRLGTTNASLKLKEIGGELSQLWII
jgi:hypothetical protein